MVTHKLLGLVNVAVIKHRAIVAGENNQCILEQIQLFESAYNLAHAPVELYNGVAAQSHFALSTETLVREAWNMYIVCGKVHEEWCVAVLLDEVNSM